MSTLPKLHYLLNNIPDAILKWRLQDLAAAAT